MRWMRSVYKTRHTNFLLKVDFTFLELFLAICGFCYLWTIFIRFELTSLFCFLCPIRSSVIVTFLSSFSPVGRDVLLSLGGVSLFHPHRLCLLSLSFLFVCTTKWEKKKTESKLNKNNKEKSWIKENYLFPGRLGFSVAHAEGLAAFLIRAVVTYPSASQRT